MVLEVNGVNLIPYLKWQGFNWRRNDVEGSDAGRTQDIDMHRNRLGMKVRLDCECTPIRLADASKVLTTIEPEFVTVRYTDPMQGKEVTKTMYSNNCPATFCKRDADGTDWWMGITFPLIEK